jgi:broad specificity phosphatase PhoE
VIDERLAELSMGDWEGRSWAEIEAVDGVRLTAWMNRWESDAAPGGETLPDFQTRVRAAAAEITEPAIWITHAGVIRTLRVRERGITWPEAMREAVAHLEPQPFGATCPTA